MALGNSSNAIYLSVSNGKIVRQFKNATEHSVSRVSKTGKTVNEEMYDHVTGKITDISIKENEYGKFWMITIQDGSERYILQFNYSGGTASAFLKQLPNVDFSKDLKLIPKQSIEGEKKKSTIFINQGGTALKWFWNKENPGSLPPLEKIKIKGKEQWDDSDQMEYLEKYVKEMVLPKLKPSNIESIEMDGEHAAAGDDELPF